MAEVVALVVVRVVGLVQVVQVRIQVVVLARVVQVVVRVVVEVLLDLRRVIVQGLDYIERLGLVVAMEVCFLG